MGQFSQKASTRVYFATGSAKIDADGQQALRSIANQASGINGSLLRVVGFTGLFRQRVGQPEAPAPSGCQAR